MIFDIDEGGGCLEGDKPHSRGTSLIDQNTFIIPIVSTSYGLSEGQQLRRFTNLSNNSLMTLVLGQRAIGFVSLWTTLTLTRLMLFKNKFTTLDTGLFIVCHATLLMAQ